MRGFWPVLLAFSITAAQADNLIDIPTARKLPYGMFRLELADDLYDSQSQLAWFDAGIGKSFEASFSAMRFGRQPIKTSEDIEYSLVSPFPGLSPGIAFGVQDLANTSLDQRRAYGVVTWREPIDTFDGEVSLDFTFGTYIRKSVLPFGGISLPFSHKVRLMAEYDGFRPIAGIEFMSSRALSFRLLYRQDHTLGDVVWTGHF